MNGRDDEMTIQITHSDWYLEAFGLDKGCKFFADKLPNGNYLVWDGLESDVEVRSNHCVEVGE